MTRRTCLNWIWVGAAALAFPPAAAATRLPEGVDATTGFRMDRYRAPTPDYLPGGTVVDDDWMLARAGESDLHLIDVFPPRGLGPDPLDGHWLTNDVRESLPGSHWLPEVGRGHLEPDAQEYFERNLARISARKRDARLLFFCTADCWQGWNAARRAVLMGYTQVHWYPAGTDGWAERGQPLKVVEPRNFLQ